MDNLDRLVEARRADVIRDLQELVRVESVRGPGRPGAPFGQGVREALDLFLAKGRALGFATEDFRGFAGHLEFGQGEQLVGVLAHLDVVPAGSGWSRPPFGGELADGRLYGRGATDDKGPAIACLHALAALRETGLQSRRRLRLILGCDEESDWACMREYFSSAERPSYGFSPDAQFPLINAEKGSLALRWTRAWGAEMDAPALIRRITGGARHNVVPEWCEAEVRTSAATALQIREALSRSGVPLTIVPAPDGLVLQARGVAAHASLPEKGENAIGRLFHGLRQTLPWLGRDQAETVRFLADEVGQASDGSGLGLRMADEISGSLTLSIGTIAWDQQGVSLEVDVRYPVTREKDEILDCLADRIGRAGFRSTVFLSFAPLHVRVEHPLVAKLMRVYTEKTGHAAAPLAVGGRTYACTIGTGVAFGPVFPGGPELAHVRDEYIDLDELMLCARIYAAAMAALLT